MKRPIESDYTSHVAYTRALEAYCDNLAKPAPPPPECKTEAEQLAYAFGWWKALESVRTEQPAQEPRNFCPRCGKRRGGDVNYIHTCTPPRGLEMT